MKYQLFVKKPNINLVIDIIKLFGLNGFDDINLFTKLNLLELKTVGNFKNIIPILKEYYLPCKAKIYLTSLDEKKCITILRQLLKKNNYNLVSNEKYIKGVKYNFYHIKQITNNKENTISPERKILLSFD